MCIEELVYSYIHACSIHSYLDIAIETHKAKYFSYEKNWAYSPNVSVSDRRLAHRIQAHRIQAHRVQAHFSFKNSV